MALRTHASERGARFVHNDFLANDLLVEVNGNGDAPQVAFEGNHWAAYAGYDLDADGVGDLAFQVKRATSNLREAQPLLRFFQGTPALGLYDALSLAMPFFGARVVLEDVRPAMRPHRELAP